MAITRVATFRTSDNREFDNVSDANAHEARLELINMVGEDALKQIEAKYRLVAHRNPRRTPEEKAADEAAAALEKKAKAEAKAAEKAAKAVAAVKEAEAKAKADSKLKVA